MTTTLRAGRGNTIPETALVISLVLLVTFGIVQYALVGFNQLGADGATFIGDHSAVAYYSGPTTSNVNYAQQVGSTNFPHAKTAFSAYIPKDGTYEIRSDTTYAAHNFIYQFFPSTIASHSRIVEPSASVASGNAGTSGPSNCANALEAITFGGGQSATGAIAAGQTLLSAPITLPGGTTFNNGVQQAINGASAGGQQLYNIAPDVNGNAAISYTNSSLNSEITAIGAIQSDFSTTTDGLLNINRALKPFGHLADPLTQVISAQLSPLINTAVGGTYTTTINKTTPVGSVQFTAQLSAASAAIKAVEATPVISNALGSILGNVVNPALFGGTIPIGYTKNGQQVTAAVTTTGIVPALGDMNAYQGVLATLDNATNVCP